MKKLLLLTTLLSVSLWADCVNMGTSLACTFNDETVKGSNQVKGVKYTGSYNENRSIKSIDIDLKNQKNLVFINLHAYKDLTELKITKNSTSKAYVKLANFVIKIEDNQIIKEVKDEKDTK